MTCRIFPDATILGRNAADDAAARLGSILAEVPTARLLLSTGASQFPFFEALRTCPLPWDRIEVFHLDEYVGLPPTHPASFRRYLHDRLVDAVRPLAFHEVQGDRDPAVEIRRLSELVLERPMDVALVGIGENAHIAFNDPPADFDAPDPFLLVTLDDACRRQQVGEGWFPDLASVPRQAVTMSVRQILRSRAILSVVPHAVKAGAIRRTLSAPEPTPDIPATALLAHPDWTLYLDEASAGGLDPARRARCS